MKAVIQAGGRGTRLMPYTSVLPKPLMPIGAKPVLELLVKWLRRNGIEELYITTGYLGHLIRSFCGDGRQWGLHIVYTEETEPLGTIGALSSGSAVPEAVRTADIRPASRTAPCRPHRT